MEVTEELYSWMVQLELVKGEMQADESNKIQLDAEDVADFESGEKFKSLLKHLNQMSNGLDRLVTPMPEINTLKEVTNASTKLYNWNILLKAMEVLGVNIDHDIKSLIVAGDSALIVEVLSQLHTAYKAAQATEKEPSAKRGGRPTQSYKKTKINPDGGILIDSIDTEKPLFEADSCLEFLVLSFCHNFSLKPKQAVGLLTQGNKYLSQVVAKGLKGDFDAILYWIQDVYSNTERLADLIQAEMQADSLKLVLNALKTGLLSKSIDAVKWTYRVFTKVSLEFAERNMLDKVWTWFSGENGGIELVLMTSARFQTEVIEQLLEFLLHVAQFNLLELFTLKLRNILGKVSSYVGMMHDFLPYIAASETFAEELETSGVLNYWIELCIKEIETKRSIGLVIACLNFVVDIWVTVVAKRESNEFIANSIIVVMSKACRDDSSYVLQTTAYAQFFKLLLIFADEQNQYAPIIYKTLTFLLVENHQNVGLREFILTNFKQVIEQVKTIPISILIEPLVKRIQVSEGTSYVYNTFDIDFLVAVTQHPRLGIKNAIQLIDLLAKIYLDDLVYARAAFLGFSNLAFRFIETQAMQDFLLMYCRIGCNLIVTMEHPKYQPPPAQDEGDFGELYKRDFILDMICWLLQLECEEVNSQLKDLVITCNQDYRKAHRNQHYKGFLVVLTFFGDPMDVIRDFSELHPDMFPVKKAANSASDLDKSGSQIVPFGDRQLAVADDQPKKKGPQPFPWKRANDDIEKAKARRAQLDKQKREEEEAAAKRLEINKKKIKGQLDIRKSQFGVDRSNTGWNNTIFKEGHVSANLVVEENFIKEWCIPAETDEYEAVQIILKKYARVFKVLFESYTGTGHERKLNHAQCDFEWLAERKTRINASEIVKLFSDYKVVPTMCSKEQTMNLLKMFCQKVSKTKEQHLVDLKHWPLFFSQMAFFVYSRNQNLLNTYPYVLQVKTLVGHLRNQAKAQGKSTEIYDEPDPGTGDKDVVRRLNRELAKNPNMQLPNGYKAVKDKDLKVEFKPPDVPPLQQMALGIIDSILYSGLKFHIFEPQITFTETFRAKGVPAKKIEIVQIPIQERRASTQKHQIKQVKPRSESREPPKHIAKISAAMKLQIAKAPQEEQSHLKQVAEVLEDVIHSATLNMNRIINRNQGSQAAKNKVMKAREEQRILEERQAKMQSQRRRKRMETISAEIAQDQDAKKKTKQAQDNKRKERERQAKEKAERKKELLESERLARHEEMKKWKEAKAKEQAAAEAELELQKQNSIQDKTALKRHQTRVRNEIAAKSQQLQSKKQHDTMQRQKTLEGPQQMQVLKNLAEQKIKRELDSKKQAEFEEFDAAVQPLIQRYEKNLKILYDFYRKLTITVNPDTQNTIAFKDFNKFCSNFMICPDLVPTNDMKSMHRKLTNESKDSSIDFSGFVKFLNRVSIMSRNELNKSEIDGPPREVDLELFLGYLGLNDTPTEIKARLTDQHESHAGNRKATTKRITYQADESLDEFY